MDNQNIKDLLSKNYFWILIVLTTGFIYFAPISIPADIAISGKIYPAKQWLLFAGTNGQIMNTQIDLVAGISNIYETREFSRGDDVRFEINQDILSKDFIKAGDTIGVIYSYETNTLLNAAKWQLEIEKALLKSYQTGEKVEVINLAQKRLDYAKMDAEIQLREFNRQKILHEQEVIPDQTFEYQQRLAQLKQVQTEINEAEVNSLASGEKPEQIEYVKAQINKLQSDIRDLEKKLQMHTIYAPFAGIFRNSFSSDTLMILESMDELIIKMPVNLKDRDKVYLGQDVRCTVFGQQNTFDAEVVHISNRVSVASTKQIFIVTAKISDSETKMLPGIVFKGKMDGDRIKLREFVGRWFRFTKS